MPGDETQARRQKERRPAFEALEARRLLTRPLPLPPRPPNVRDISVNRAIYHIEINGPGVLRVAPAGRGLIGLTLLGTTEESTLNITRTRVGPHWVDSGLPLGRIDVRSGLLGGVEALDAADLLGPMTPINSSVRDIKFRSLAGNASIDIAGNLNNLDARSIRLGDLGLVHVGRAINGAIDVTNSLTLDGGEILVDQGPIGGISANALHLLHDGRISTSGAIGNIVVTTDLTIDSGGSLNAGTSLGGIQTGRDLRIGPAGLINVGTDSLAPIRIGQDLVLDGGPILIQGNLVGGLTVGRDVLVQNGGQFVVYRDISGPVAIGNNLTLDAGNFSVGRDITGPVTIGGNLALAHGGVFGVGRDLAGGLSITGNFDSSQVGTASIGGNLNGLSITGALIGQGSFDPAVADLRVGLDLLNLTVLGAVPNQGSISNANIDIGKSLIGLDVRHGIFNSLITAGVLIDGGPGSAGGNIGPDATYAVFDSEILAGAQIRNLVLNGDVASDQVTNPNGHRTRIVAGETRGGIISPAASIENFQITGRLIDSVVVASVAPSGGDGNLDPNALPTPSVGNYDAPAGTITGGTIGSEILYPHNTPGSYDAFGRLTGYVYDPVKTPVPDDLIMFGAINRSFAPTPLASNPPPADGTAIPLPTKSTVLGGVVDTAPPGDAYDHAGLFAADTYGVFVGVLPKSATTTTST